MPRGTRKTRWQLVAVETGRSLVGVDSWVANRLVEALLRESPPFGLPAGRWRREVRYRDVRFDFGRVGPDSRGPTALVEVKSGNLAEGTTALFPDAPTSRGAHHLERMAQAARRGLRAMLIVVVLRSDVRTWQPNAAADPVFAERLREAQRAGVEIRAVSTAVRPGAISWGTALPINRTVDRVERFSSRPNSRSP